MKRMNDTPSRPIRSDFHGLTLFFTVDDCAKAIEFYRAAFGAELLSGVEGPDGTIPHAEMRIGDTWFALGDPMPGHGLVGPPAEGNAFSVMYWTPDVDAVFDRAVKAGATVLSPVEDAFSGDRMGVLRCPYGIRWVIARHDRDVPYAEIESAAREWLAAAE